MPACRRCNKSFASKGNLKRHVENIHFEDDEDDEDEAQEDEQDEEEDSSEDEEEDSSEDEEELSEGTEVEVITSALLAATDGMEGIETAEDMVKEENYKQVLSAFKEHASSPLWITLVVSFDTIDKQ